MFLNIFFCIFPFTAIPYIDQNSYSNSNNGGSVNSQDSLWKAPQLVPNDQQINMQNQTLNHNHLHPNMHHQQSHQNHRNSGNYDHHQSYNNPADDYVPYESRSNYATDPYGPIPKPKRRLDLIGKSPS